jgi:hypothetical protein
MSTTAREWGFQSISRALRGLGVALDAAFVVSGMGADGSPGVGLVVVPGVDGARLSEVFAPIQERGRRFRSGTVRDVKLRFCSQALAPNHPVSTDGWLAVDGFVVSYGASDATDQQVGEALVRLKELLSERTP